MPVTTPDSIFYRNTATPAALETESATQASSIQAALTSRGQHRYRWADTAARNAQTGMSIDDHGYQIDTGATYRYNGSAWKEQSYYERFQADGLNSVRNVIQQSGIGKITGAGTGDASEAVTFPTAFSSVPVVVASFTGARATGVYNPVGLSALTVGTASAQVPSTTGFTAQIFRSTGTFTSGNDYYYSWIAVGVPA
jgi:hypothetical protein